MNDCLFTPSGECPPTLTGNTGAVESNNSSLPYRKHAPDTSRQVAEAAAGMAGGAGVNDINVSPDTARLPLVPPAHHKAPVGTSSVAAKRIAGHAPIQRSRVLRFIVEHGEYGATDEEGEAALRIKPQSYTPRRGELVKLGLVCDSGQRRNTESCRPAAVWVAIEFAPKQPGGDS